MINTIMPFTLSQVYDTVEKVSTAHVGIAHFDSGTEVEIGDNNTYSYPLAYLEEIVGIQEGENKRTHSYDLALNILDQLPKNATRQQRIQIQDKCFQLFCEVKQYLTDKVFGKERVEAFNVSVAPDFSNDKTMRVRGEFRIQVSSFFTPQTPISDLSALFPSLT